MVGKRRVPPKTPKGYSSTRSPFKRPAKIRKRRGFQLGFGNLILYGRAYLNDTRLI